MGGKKAVARFTDAPTALRSKAEVGGPGAVDAAALARAEQVIADMAGDYLEWVEDDLLNIDEVVDNLKAAKWEERPEQIERIFQFSHDIKGQGGSFGYGMMTRIGDQLCAFVETLEGAGAAEIEVIGLHIDAMKLVIANRMSGDGGEEAEKLFDDLKKVTEKVAAN